VNIAMTDRELLDQLRRDRSEAAFTELVRRHIDLVHSAALRQLGDADAARDLTQQVFIELARQAGRLRPEIILTGWLYRTTRHLCLETLRRDRRRREREHTAAAQLMNDATANPWEQVAPALEPAMDELGETDRQAILLRYFENRSLREVGTALGLGEDAAQKRVSRALDRLREIFSQRGVSLSATVLAGSLSAGAVQAAPAGLAVTISTAALGGAAVATVTTLATEGASTAMNLINLKTAAAILGAAAVTGTATYVVQEREAEQLRTENTTLNQTHAKLASDQQESLEMIQLRDEQIERLRRDVADLPRLRGEVDGLRRRLGGLEHEMAALETENARLRKQHSPTAEPVPAEVLRQHQEAYLRQTEEKRNSLRSLGLMYRLFANDNPGKAPPRAIRDLIQLLGEDSSPVRKLFESGFSYASIDQYDVLYPEHFPLFDTDDAETRIHELPLLRERNSVATPDGKWSRIYLFGDGSPEVITMDSVEELAAWEKRHLNRIGLGDAQP
jgi:RNA polymerase sigma factor (sigma-70 family)